jgi:hypothetical protein
MAPMSGLLSFHPLATLFQPMRAKSVAYLALVEDIRQHGLHEPIVLYQNMILDDRNRYRACLDAGVEPRFRQFDPATEGSPEAFIWSANAYRRHRTPGQLTILISEEADGQRGGDRRSAAYQTPDQEFDNSVDAVVERRGGNKTMVYDYRKALKTAHPNVVARVREGRMSVNWMADAAQLPEAEQIKLAHALSYAGDKQDKDRPKPKRAGAKTDLEKAIKQYDNLSDEDKKRFRIYIDGGGSDDG